MLVEQIRKYGHIEKFYKKDTTYYSESGKVYWTMGEPIDETDIVNRCDPTQMYEYRLARNDLPAQRVVQWRQQ